MYPILLTTPWFNVYSYGLMMAVGYAIGTWVILREVDRDGLPSEPVFDMLLLQMVVGVLGARLLYLLEYSSQLATVPSFFDFEKGGLTFYGAVISSFVFDLLFLKFKGLPFWRVMDSVGIGLAVGMIFARTGCFLNGCCFGVACGYPWGVVFSKVSPTPVHPTQLYEAFGGFLLFVLMKSLQHRRRSYGHLFLGFIAGYAIFRFLLEFWRGDNPVFLLGMSLSQVLGLVLLQGVALVWTQISRSPELRVLPGTSAPGAGSNEKDKDQ